MLVQIRDRSYLETQRNIHPNVVDDMYRLAGHTFTIEDRIIDPDKQYSYKSFQWLGRWLFDANPETQPAVYHLPKTNFETFIGHIDVNAMPEKLQHIRFVSSHFPQPRYTQDFGGFTIAFEQPQSGSRAVDPSMYIKFEGATEYNVTRYLVMESIGHEIRPYDTRAYEHLVIEVFNVLGDATRKYLDEIRNDTIILNERGLKDINILHYQANFEFIDFSYIPHFIAMAFTHLSANVKLEKVNMFNEHTDKSLIYMSKDDACFYGFTEAHYNTYLYNYEIKECPVFGIKYIGKDPVQVFLRVAFTNYSDKVLVPNWNYTREKDFLDYVYERLEDTDHKWSSMPRGYFFRGSVYTKEGYDEILAHFEKYKVYGLSMDTDYFTYNGNRFYLGDDDTIQDYDYEPYIEFYGDSNDLHLGVELEIDNAGESHDNALMVMAPISRFAYAMHDGSLDEGFEIATMPMTLAYAESVKDRFNDSMGIARLLGYNSHNTSSCGLHIHFDRDFFGRDYRTQNTKASYLAIIMERNWEKFVQFSRRNYSRLENWAKKLDLVQDIYADDTEDDAQSKFSRKYGNGDKYIALNTSHSNTYELRIFRGTLKLETFFATMQFVDNLVRVAKDCTSLAKAQQITFADIIDYKHYKELIEYVNTRGILTREYKEYEGA